MARVPTNSKWRKAKNIYYLEDLREAPEADLEKAVATLTTIEQPLLTQALLPPLEPLKGLVRLVTKVVGWEWPMVRRLVRVVLG